METTDKIKATTDYNGRETFIVRGYGAENAEAELKEMDIEHAKPAQDEVRIEVLYSGVCHSDVHQVRNDWENTRYPCVPGHEIIGKVKETGSGVTKFKEGDIVGVGCMIDSCQECTPCKNGEEQFCIGEHGPTMTYNGYFKDPESDFNTFGGYSEEIVSKEKFVLTIPEALDISKAAPILCAGITTYSPLKHWGVKKGDKVGIIGIGGLGHMGVMLAKAMGAEVTAITTTESKRKDALEIGADHVLISENEEDMNQNMLNFDLLLCTIPTAFDINPYIELLSPRGSIITVGLLGAYESPTNNMPVAMYARSVAGSIIGGIKETQEVLDFCAEHQIHPEVEMIDMKDINEAFEKMNNENVRFRSVIDMQSLKNG